MKIKQKFLNYLLLLFFSMLAFEYGCLDDLTDPHSGKTTLEFNPAVTYGSLTDQDGNTYKTVKIGNQTWMAENLRTTKYNDGTGIYNVSVGSWWTDLTIPAYCSFNNTKDESVITHGMLYNWYTVNTGKLAPEGWHVPSDAEWAELRKYLGGESVAGFKLKEAGSKHWIGPNSGATNISGFTAIPGGTRNSKGDFEEEELCNFWSANESGIDSSGYVWNISQNDGFFRIIEGNKRYGYHVRCIKDGDNYPSADTLTNGRTTAVFNPDITYGKMTDQNGNEYKTVVIGNQTWMAENLRTTTYTDGSAIPNIIDSASWCNLESGAYCNYNNTEDIDTIATYGRLYNWHTIKNGKLAPPGWHIPSDEECIQLRTYLSTVTGGKLKEAGITHWNSPNTQATNIFGFTAVPAGIRFYDGSFWNIGKDSFYSSSTQSECEHVNVIYLTYNRNALQVMQGSVKSGLSVRCIKD